LPFFCHRLLAAVDCSQFFLRRLLLLFLHRLLLLFLSRLVDFYCFFSGSYCCLYPYRMLLLLFFAVGLIVAAVATIAVALFPGWLLPLILPPGWFCHCCHHWFSRCCFCPHLIVAIFLPPFAGCHCHRRLLLLFLTFAAWYCRYFWHCLGQCHVSLYSTFNESYHVDKRHQAFA